VQDLLNKIEAAAEVRLTFSPGTAAAEKLARYKNFLKVEAHRLKLPVRMEERFAGRGRLFWTFCCATFG
jgi:hypothetical protein